MPFRPPDPRVLGYLKYLGFWAGGDVGGYTIYQTRRGKRVAYPISPPLEPPSPAQSECRNRFGLAIRRWKLLTPGDRLRWEALSKQLELQATGLNLYIHLSLIRDRDAWATAVARTGTTLTPPAWIPL